MKEFKDYIFEMTRTTVMLYCNFLNCWKPLRALLTTASRKAKRMFENNKDWAISSEAPVKWRTFNGQSSDARTWVVLGKWEAS